MRGIRTSDRLLIAGQTGKGKTTLARYLVERLQPMRVIVFDPKGELSFAGVEPCRDPEQLPERMRDRLAHYIPASFDRPDLELACQVVWSTPGPYIWWIDEAAEMSSANYCPAGLRLGVTQGRLHRKMIIACTQRIVECHPVFRSQSEHVILFVPPPIMLDLKTIAGNVRREALELERELAALHARHGDFSHLWYVRDTDELRICAPLPLGVPPGSPRSTPSAEPAGVVGSRTCEDSDSGSGPSSRSPSSR